MTAFLISQIVSGHTRTCLYETDEGGSYAMTVEAADQCPHTVEIEYE